MRRAAKLLLCSAIVAGTLASLPADAAQRIGPVKYVKKTVKLLPQQAPRPIRVLCPEPYIVSAGGFSDGTVSSSGPIDAARDRDRRRDDGWRIVAGNPTSGKRHIDVYAVCVKPGSAKHRYVSSQPVDVAPGAEAAQAHVDCPDGSSVVGGGLTFSDRSGRIEWTSPMDGPDADDDRDDGGWTVEVRSESARTERLVARAICQQGLTDTYVEFDTSVPIGGQTVVAVCPAGTTAVGGGIEIATEIRSFIRGTTSYEWDDARSWASIGDRWFTPSGPTDRTDTAVCRDI